MKDKILYLREMMKNTSYYNDFKVTGKFTKETHVRVQVCIGMFGLILRSIKKFGSLEHPHSMVGNKMAAATNNTWQSPNQ